MQAPAGHLSGWFYERGARKFGPYTSHQLQQLAASGQLVREDMVWKPGMQGWVFAATIKGLFPEPEIAGGLIATNTTNYFVGVRGGTRHGPFALQQIQEMCDRGTLDANDLVWREGFATWIELGKLPGVKLRPMPPPVPPAPDPPALVALQSLVDRLEVRSQEIADAERDYPDAPEASGLESLVNPFKRLFRACPNCGQLWGCQLDKKVLLGKRSGMVAVTRRDEHYTPWGQPAGSTYREEQVRATFQTIKSCWSCKFCHHKWGRRTTETIY